ncbi:MAG: hypothetical protein ACFNUU_04200 [Campylobacter sp.]|uniref:hypothetical protein n=1 Tax=Campylobacter sp. TaxID=205 RepID=UPI00361BAA0A
MAPSRLNSKQAAYPAGASSGRKNIVRASRFTKGFLQKDKIFAAPLICGQRL